MNKILNWVTKNPEKAATALSWPFLITSAQYAYQVLTNEKPITPEEIPYVATITLSPIIALIAGMFGFSALNRLTYNKETIRAIKELEKELEQQKPPTPQYTGEYEVKLSTTDYLYATFRAGGSKAHEATKNAKYGRKNKHPAFLIFAAEGYIAKKQYDEALLCIRDALDIMNGKKPKLHIAYKFGNPIDTLGFKLDKFCRPAEPELYLTRATQLALATPEKAWKYSQLAKKIATTTKHPLEPETYIFDALLAQAQNRTDTEQTWRETIALILQTGTPQRLGESRNPVWIIANNKFLANTIVFKGNKKRQALTDEITATQTLEQILGESATTPTPLHLTDQPHGELYVYAMRYLAGQLLQDQLLAGNYTNIPTVIEVLARIHAKYPTTKLARLDIDKKHEEKLHSRNLNLPNDLIALLMQGLQPIANILHTEEQWVANKDAHPEQWQMNGQLVGVLDAEITTTHPPLLDLANLLEYTTTFSPKQRREYIEKYLQHARTQGMTPTTDPQQQYCAAVIHRMISLIEAWSAPDRTPKHPERARLADNAITAAKQLQNEAQDKEPYQKLTKGLESLREQVA